MKSTGKQTLGRRAWAFALLLLLAGWACRSSDTEFRGSFLPGDLPSADFTLTDQNGQPWTLSQQRGKVVVMFFGFTYCPDICPLTLSTWKKVEEALGEDAQRVAFVYVTVDPERDTPERIKEHLAVFSPNFVGLTGRPQELQPVYASYGIYREKEPISEGYLVNHTSTILLIDKQGRWRVNHAHDAAVEDLVHDIRLLLRED